MENYKLSDDYGYILEVDLDYPSSLHNQHAHFENPLGEYIKYEKFCLNHIIYLHFLYTTAPYMSVIKYDDLSEESKEMLAKTGKKGENYKAKKLVNDFKYVKNYKINFLILFSNKKHFFTDPGSNI